jgi:hypothetical protein
MRNLLLIGLALVVLTAGCKKASNTSTSTQTTPTSNASSGNEFAAHAPSGVVLNPGLGGGGGGGAAQAVRKAATRIVTQFEMKDIHLVIETAYGASGQMPSKEEIEAVLKSQKSKASPLLGERVIVLTGTRTRENIWAYTQDAQNSQGHFVATSNGIETISTEALRQRLEREKGS